MLTKLTALAIAGLTLASATLAEAQDRVRWRLHSAYAQGLPVAGPTPHDIAETVKLLSDEAFDIRPFEPGALVPGAAYYDAVSEGSIDAAYGSPGFNVGKNSAFAFFAAVPFGPNAGEMLAWYKHGGGQQLADEIYGRDNIHMIPCGILPPESGGWFRKEITSLEDLKGIKMRFLGLGAKVMEQFGVSTQLLAPGEIYQALELGTLDGAEQSIPAIDRNLGFWQIAKFNYFPGWHQQSTVQELLINKEKWDALSDAQRAMVNLSCDKAMLDQFAGGEAGQFEIMQQNEKDGVQIKEWPTEMLDAFRTGWEKVIAEETTANADSAKIWASLSEFRENYKVWGERAYLK